MLINFNLSRESFFLYNFKNLIFRLNLKYYIVVFILFILLLIDKISLILLDFARVEKNCRKNILRNIRNMWRRGLNSQETFLSDPSKR